MNYKEWTLGYKNPIILVNNTTFGIGTVWPSSVTSKSAKSESAITRSWATYLAWRPLTCAWTTVILRRYTWKFLRLRNPRRFFCRVRAAKLWSSSHFFLSTSRPCSFRNTCIIYTLLVLSLFRHTSFCIYRGYAITFGKEGHVWCLYNLSYCTGHSRTKKPLRTIDLNTQENNMILYGSGLTVRCTAHVFLL